MQIRIESLTVDKSLRVTYRVENIFDRAVYVHDMVQMPRYQKDDAWVHFQGGILVLFIGTAKPPRLVCLYWPGTPPARRLDPGGSFNALIERAMPIKESTIGMHSEPTEKPEKDRMPYEGVFEDATATHVCLVVEYHIDGTKGLKAKKNPTGLFTVTGATPARAEAWVRLENALGVRRWTGEFPRVRPVGR